MRSSAEQARAGESGAEALGLILVCGAMALALWLWLSGELAGLALGGGRPGAGVADMARVLMSLPRHLSDPAKAWPRRGPERLPGALGMYAALCVTGGGLLGVLALELWAARRLRLDDGGRPRRWVDEPELRPRGLLAGARGADGLAERRDLRRHELEGPGLGRVPGPSRFLLGRSGRRALWCPADGNLLVLGPARSGKSRGVILPNLRRWPGGLVVTSLRPEAYRWAREERDGRGPLAVFDPAGLVGAPEARAWWPWQGAADWDRAIAVARAMTGALEDRATTNSRYFADRAAELLAPLFHAAALEGASLARVRGWAGGLGLEEAVATLRARGAPTAASDLAAFCAERDDQGSGRQATMATARRALGWAARSGVQAALDPGRHPVLDPSALIAAGGTLVVVSPAAEMAELSPLMSALLATLAAVGQEMAFRAPGERLPVPFGFVLDEVPSIAPFPGLPQLMATGGGFGMPSIAVAQDLAQVAARWSDNGAQTIWNNAACRLITPGVSDRLTEEAVTRAAGEVLTRRRSGSARGGVGERDRQDWHEAWEPTLRRGELARIPERWALLLAAGIRPLPLELAGQR